MVYASERASISCAVVSFDGWRPTSRRDAMDVPMGHDAHTGSPLIRVSSPAQLEVIRPFVEEFRLDLLHVHHGMLWGFAKDLQDFSDIPAIKSVHTLQLAQNRIRGIEGHTKSLRGQFQAFAEAELLIAPSDFVAGWLRHELPETTSRLRLIHLGIEDSERAQKAVEWPQEGQGGAILYAGVFPI
jgi:hypothetical protein